MMNQPGQHTFPELAKALRSRQRSISVRAGQSVLDGESVVTSLAEQLNAGTRGSTPNFQLNGDSVAGLLAAYHALRQAVAEEAANELHRNLRTDELAALNER